MENASAKYSFDFTGVKIIVAEDDPISMLIISKMLGMKNASVHEAENGNEAIQLLEEIPDVNIVLLDLEMPAMNGYMTVRAIRKKFPAMPVIAVTANLIDKDMHKQLAHDGFTDSVSKPFDPDVFYNKILKAVKTTADGRQHE